MTWTHLLSLREGGILGHRDIEMLTARPQLGSVGLGQGNQLESAPWGPACTELPSVECVFACWEKTIGKKPPLLKGRGTNVC